MFISCTQQKSLILDLGHVLLFVLMTDFSLFSFL